MGGLDSNDFHLEPFARFPPLLDFAWIFMPVKHFLLLEGQEQTSPVQQDLGGCLLVVGFKMSPHGQLLNLLIE